MAKKKQPDSEELEKQRKLIDRQQRKGVRKSSRRKTRSVLDQLREGSAKPESDK